MTRAQETFAAYISGVPPDTVTRFKQVIARSPRFRRVYSNPDAVIYKLAPLRK